MSTDYAHPTRLECKRLLEAIGVSVVVQNADGMALLKCRASERRGESSPRPRDHCVLLTIFTLFPIVLDSSSVGPTKSVKFRVEFSSHTSLSNSPLLGSNGTASSGSASNSPDLRGQYPTVVTLVME